MIAIGHLMSSVIPKNSSHQSHKTNVAKMVLIYGGIAGAVIIGVNTLSYEFGLAYAWLGFLVMLIAFSTIFFAMRQYRDEVLGGVIKVSTGFLFGLGIATVASVVYVSVWEIYLHATDFEFIEVYIATILETLRIQGASQAEIEAAILETEDLRRSYSNDWYRMGITLTEILPVGVLVSLVSAIILKQQPAEVTGK